MVGGGSWSAPPFALAFTLNPLTPPFALAFTFNPLTFLTVAVVFQEQIARQRHVARHDANISTTGDQPFRALDIAVEAGEVKSSVLVQRVVGEVFVRELEE